MPRLTTRLDRANRHRDRSVRSLSLGEELTLSGPVPRPLVARAGRATVFAPLTTSGRRVEDA